MFFSKGDFEFCEAEYPPEHKEIGYYLKKGYTESEASQIVNELQRDDSRLLVSPVYQVDLKLIKENTLFWMSFKRRDKEPILDRKVYCDIIKGIFNSDFIGMELFPAESRLVDTANQYHLWGWFMEDKNSVWTKLIKMLHDGVAVSDGGKRQKLRQMKTKNIKDWREIQKLKNKKFGEEEEGVQFFTKEKMSNYVTFFPEGQKAPFGYRSRLIMTSDEAERYGAKQRDFA